MSADNGIYILRTVRTKKQEEEGRFNCRVKCSSYYVYRVAHASAIDNFDWFEKNEPYNIGAYMKEIWGNSPVFENLDEAQSHANKMLNMQTEYGVSIINTDYKFYSDM